MAAFIGLYDRVLLGPLDLSGLAREVHFGDLTRQMKPATTFNDGGFACVLPGLISAQATVKGNQDFATGVLDDQISVGQLGSQYPFTVIPSPTGTVTAADPCWLSRGVLSKLNPLDGSKGDVGSFDLSVDYDTIITAGKVLHPAAARTATGTGTAVAQAGPTAAQKLYAGLHVTAFSGLTSLVVTVESDDNSGFTSATTRITFATATGVTSEFASIVGSFVSETHHRVKYTIVGTGSVTFSAAIGVI